MTVYAVNLRVTPRMSQHCHSFCFVMFVGKEYFIAHQHHISSISLSAFFKDSFLCWARRQISLQKLCDYAQYNVYVLTSPCLSDNWTSGTNQRNEIFVVFALERVSHENTHTLTMQEDLDVLLLVALCIAHEAPSALTGATCFVVNPFWNGFVIDTKFDTLRFA